MSAFRTRRPRLLTYGEDLGDYEWSPIPVRNRAPAACTGCATDAGDGGRMRSLGKRELAQDERQQVLLDKLHERDAEREEKIAESARKRSRVVPKQRRALVS
jgi:hypothetical protein